MAEGRTQKDEAPVTARADGAATRVLVGGDWTVETCQARERELGAELAEIPGGGTVEFDLNGLTRFDTSGAWLVHRAAGRLEADGHKVRFRDLDEKRRILLEEVAENEPSPVKEPREMYFVERVATDTGWTLINAARDLRGLINLFGEGAIITGQLALRPGRVRYTSLLHHLETMGLRAVPIVALISILIGGIIEQQGVYQLRGFGAEIYSVDLAGILILRELGVLLTSIMVAGRTGSAITAEIGSMKMREEIDAMRTLALNPTEVLIMPRLVALMISLPLLTFLSDMACLFGAGIVAWIYIDLPPMTFITHLRGAIDFQTFMVGLIKAPFMAVAIGLIACQEGLAVEGSAEALGNRTTASVVKAIFTVIVLDGFFAIFFSAINL